MKLVLATANAGKVREIERILEGLGVTLLTPDDLDAPPEVVEDGLTFEANAVKKARAFAQASGLPALADDSGLCVDALDGRPGVWSARYGGPEANDATRYQRLLSEMADVPDGRRQAAFVCVAALCRPDGECLTCEGRCEGVITREPAGENGFGYDPVFFVPEYNRTMAQLPLETKNLISHRGRALAAMRDKLAAFVK